MAPLFVLSWTLFDDPFAVLPDPCPPTPADPSARILGAGRQSSAWLTLRRCTGPGEGSTGAESFPSAAGLRSRSLRRESTLTETIRKAWTGVDFGATNAEKARCRHLPCHKYRFTRVRGIQTELAGPFVSPTAEAAGTAQRVVWASAEDPTVPLMGLSWPGSLDTRCDWTTTVTTSGHKVISVASRIIDEVRANRYAILRETETPRPPTLHTTRTSGA